VTRRNDFTIKRAYRQQAAQFHPDKLPNVPEPVKKLAEEKLRQLNAAYEPLTRVTPYGPELGDLLALKSRGEWLQACQLSGGEVILCPLCWQRNRLPEPASLAIARCGVCYALLLLPAWFIGNQNPLQS